MAHFMRMCVCVLYESNVYNVNTDVNYANKYPRYYRNLETNVQEGPVFITYKVIVYITTTKYLFYGFSFKILTE